MKTRLFVSVFFAFVFCLVSAQVPQGFNYQAIARDGSGIIVSQPIAVMITIKNTLGTGGTIIWQETQTVTTDENGVLLLTIGQGTRTDGTATVFSDIDWAAQTLYLKTEIKYPTSAPTYTDMGTTQLWSVPYSMVAKGLGGSLDKLVVYGKTPSLTEALFEVKNNNGQTIFAVYNEGVRAYVSDGLAKGAKGGFAIGGFGGTKTNAQKYFYVKPDTIRMYIDDTPGKTAKGGFAIGGFGSAKTDYSFLKVDEAIIKGGKTEYIKLSSINTFIGDGAGYSNVPSGDNGSYNSFIGYMSGYNNTSGHHNTYIGWKAGYNVGPNAHNNIFIGNVSGYYNYGSANVFIGNRSGSRNTTGTQNVFIGDLAGNKNKSGNNNMFIGSGAGRRDSSGYNNTFIGTSAGEWNIEGNNNTFIGWLAGGSNNSNTNVMIGTEAGSLTTGAGNVFIGYNAGYNEPNSNRLYISNTVGIDYATDKSNALIYGEFDNKIVTINNVLKLTPRASAPTTPTPTEGTIYINSTDHHIYCYLNSSWKQLD